MPRWARATLWMLAAALLTVLGLRLWQAFAAPWVLDPPPPRIGVDSPDTLSQNAPSIIEAPVTFDIDTAIDSLESAVPLIYGDLDSRLPLKGHPRMHFAYRLQRMPFEVQVDGPTVTISTIVEYSGRVWYRPMIGPEVSGSCGLGRAVRPRVRATLVSTGELTPQWQLRTHSRVLKLEPYSDDSSDRCRLTILKIDVTDRVIEATRKMLERHLVSFDDAASRWPVRPRFERLWGKLQLPIWLADSVYLVIHPTGARLGAIETEGGTAVAQLRLLASPTIVTGPRPAVHDSVFAIPPLETTAYVGEGVHVRLDASISYAVATRLLRRALVGRVLEQAGRRIRIRDVRLYGLGGGRMALAVTVGGAARGLLYFVGTPTFDPVNHEIGVPDLDYDAGTAGLLVRGLGWLRGVDIRDFLRESARIPESAAMGRLSALAHKGINRTLAPGVELSGVVLSADGISSSATTHAITIRAAANAQLKLAINRSPRIPRPPQ